jgi:hypothetical protein
MQDAGRVVIPAEAGIQSSLFNFPLRKRGIKGDLTSWIPDKGFRE